MRAVGSQLEHLAQELLQDVPAWLVSVRHCGVHRAKAVWQGSAGCRTIP